MGFQRRANRSTMTAGGRHASAALRWLLLVLMWPGPVPWCHSHAKIAHSESPAVATWLREHLRVGHGLASVAGSQQALVQDSLIQDAGWHVHVALPGSDDGNSGSDSRQPILPLVTSPCEMQGFEAQAVSVYTLVATLEWLPAAGRVGEQRRFASFSRWFRALFGAAAAAGYLPLLRSLPAISLSPRHSPLRWVPCGSGVATVSLMVFGKNHGDDHKRFSAEVLSSPIRGPGRVGHCSSVRAGLVRSLTRTLRPGRSAGEAHRFRDGR